MLYFCPDIFIVASSARSFVRFPFPPVPFPSLSGLFGSCNFSGGKIPASSFREMRRRRLQSDFIPVCAHRRAFNISINGSECEIVPHFSRSRGFFQRRVFVSRIISKSISWLSVNRVICIWLKASCKPFA